jgi:hypothetical protein
MINNPAGTPGTGKVTQKAAGKRSIIMKNNNFLF